MRGKPVTTSGRLVHTSSIAGVYFRKVSKYSGGGKFRSFASPPEGTLLLTRYVGGSCGQGPASSFSAPPPYRPIDHIQLGDVVACVELPL